MTKFAHKIVFAFAAVSIFCGVPAFADSFPERPIGVTVPYGPGGATDFQARIVTMLSGDEKMLGQPIYIVNKPGAGGRVGWNWFATDAEKDGYMMASYNVPSFIAQAIKGGVKFSADSFEPIANWGADPAVFIVNKDSPLNTIGDLVAFSKANPGKLTLSGGGLYNGHHIAALQLEKVTGTKMVYVPTKGGGVAALKAVLAGDVMAGVNNLSDAFRALKSGTVKVLAIADLERSKEFLPDVPTLREAGYDVDDSSVNFRGLMVPKGTSDAVIKLLSDKAIAMFSEKKVATRMKAAGSPLRIMTRRDVQKMWAERQKYLNELMKGL